MSILLSHRALAALLMVTIVLSPAAMAAARAPAYTATGNITVSPSRAAGTLQLEIWMLKPEKTDITLSGGGSVEAVAGSLNGSMRAGLLAAIESKINAPLHASINATVEGSNYQYMGHACFRASLGDALRIEGNASISHQYDPATNTSRTRVSVYDARLQAAAAPAPLSLHIDLYIDTVSNFTSKTSASTTVLRVNSENQQLLAMARPMASQYLSQLGFREATAVSYNASRGLYYIEYRASRTTEISTIPVNPQSMVNASLRANLAINAEGEQESNIYKVRVNATATLQGHADKLIIGDARIEALHADVKLWSNATHLGARLVERFDATLDDPYLAGRTVEALGRLLAGAATGKLTVHAPEPGALLIGNQLVHEATLTPYDAARGVHYVYDGAVLDKVNGEEKTYRVLTPSAVIHADTERVLINASTARKLTIQLAGNTGIVVVYTSAGRLAVSPAKPGETLGGEITLEVLAAPPASLPKTLTPLSKPLELGATKIPNGGIRAEIPFDAKKATRGTSLVVAHYHGGKWEILKPETVNWESGSVIVVLHSLSPLIVAMEKQATTTSTTTATSTTPVTTTTTTTATGPAATTTATTATDTGTTTTTTATTTRTQPEATTTTTTTGPGTGTTTTTTGTTTQTTTQASHTETTTTTKQETKTTTTQTTRTKTTTATITGTASSATATQSGRTTTTQAGGENGGSPATGLAAVAAAAVAAAAILATRTKRQGH